MMKKKEENKDSFTRHVDAIEVIEKHHKQNINIFQDTATTKIGLKEIHSQDFWRRDEDF